MSSIDTKYIALCKEILAKGNVKSDRTGTGTISLFGAEIRHDLQESFPLLTTKSVHFKSVVGELLWILSGSTNIKFLQDHKIKIWDGFADENGEVGRMYGAQMRDYRAYEDVGGDYDETYRIDQIANLIHQIKTNPDSRRMVVSAWNVGELPSENLTPVENVKAGNPSLPSCHHFFQCYVNDGKLSLMFNMRK